MIEQKEAASTPTISPAEKMRIDTMAAERDMTQDQLESLYAQAERHAYPAGVAGDRLADIDKVAANNERDTSAEEVADRQESVRAALKQIALNEVELHRDK